jgi:Tol biopolymer transport system component
MVGLPAWSPDGKQLALMAGDQAPRIVVVDTDGGGLRQLSPEGTMAFAPFWSADGKAVGYSRGNKDDQKSELVLQKLDGGTDTIIPQGESMVFTTGNGLSPDGKRLLYMAVDFQNRKASPRIWDFESKSETFLGDVEVGTVDGPQALPTACWAPDGKSFLMGMPTEKGSGIFHFTEDGQKKTRITPEGVDCYGPSWSRS